MKIRLIHFITTLIIIVFFLTLVFGETEKYEFLRTENKTKCVIETEYNLTSLTHTTPECTCFRIDSTVVNFEDERIASIKWAEGRWAMDWNGEYYVKYDYPQRDIDCCTVPFESELLIREDNEWKCKCSFKWENTMIQTNTTNCTGYTYKVFNYTHSKCMKEEYRWFSDELKCVDKKRVTEELNNLTETKQINYTTEEGIIIDADTYEKIFVHKIIK